MKTNTLWQNIVHTVAQGLVWVVPIIIAVHPDWQTMTVSGVLSLIVIYLKQYLTR